MELWSGDWKEEMSRMRLSCRLSKITAERFDAQQHGKKVFFFFENWLQWIPFSVRLLKCSQSYGKNAFRYKTMTDYRKKAKWIKAFPFSDKLNFKTTDRRTLLCKCPITNVLPSRRAVFARTPRPWCDLLRIAAAASVECARRPRVVIGLFSPNGMNLRRHPRWTHFGSNQSIISSSASSSSSSCHAAWNIQLR